VKPEVDEEIVRFRHKVGVRGQEKESRTQPAGMGIKTYAMCVRNQPDALTVRSKIARAYDSS